VQRSQLTTPAPENGANRSLDRLFVVGLLIAGGLYMAPLLTNLTAISLNDDWTQIFAFQSYLHDSILEHGEVPHRAHWLGSGFPIIAHPEYPILSPLTAVVLAFGPIGGTKLNVILVTLIGMAGMWLFCRRTLKAAVGPAVYGTLAFTFSGWLPAILQSGNYPEIYFLWFPLLAYLVLRDQRFDGALVLAGVVATVMLLDGHLNTVCCLGVLFLWSALRSRHAVVRSLIFLGITAGLAAFKLIPTIALLVIEDRSIDAYQAIETVPFQWRAFAGYQAETTGFSLGPLPWLLAFASVAWWRQTWPLLAAFVVSALLYLGPSAPIDLFWLLSRLPVLSSIDAPSKYFVVFAGFFAIALGVQTLMTVPSRWRTWLTPACTLLTVVPLVLLNRPLMSEVFTKPDIPAIDRAFTQVDTDYFVSDVWTGPEDKRPDLYRAYQRGVGLLRWEDNFQLPVQTLAAWTIESDGSTTVHSNYPQEASLAQGHGRAKVTSIGANHLKVAYTATLTDSVVVNQHYAPGWRCTPSDPIDQAGLLTIPIDAGEGVVSCAFSARALQWGAGISWTTLATLLIGLWLRRRRERALP
jgi:hypothetical protein